MTEPIDPSGKGVDLAAGEGSAPAADPQGATNAASVRETGVIPMLAYEDPATAIAWMTDAFGFVVQSDQRYTEADGRITHAQMEAGRGLIMLANPTPDYQSPRHHREVCEPAATWSHVAWVIDGVMVEVEDIDAHYARAEAAGARLLSGIDDEDFGRLYRVEDIEGDRWMFIQPA